MSEVLGPRSFLAYGRYRYLKVSLAGMAIGVAFYALCDPPAARSGSTRVGYALGTVAAALIVWLLWFGVRKRSRGSSGAPVRGWLSAHVYLGTALLLLVPLHSAFRFGWNVHTLAYALISIVVVSGVFGVFLYTLVPQPMTANRPGQKLEGLMQQIADIDAQSLNLARELPDSFVRAVQVSVEKTRIGGSVARQLSGWDPRCGTAAALRMMRDELSKLDADETKVAGELQEMIAVKQTLLKHVRRDVRYRALLDLWLLVHVPLSLAAFVAVAAHVFLVFYYR